MKQLAMFVLIAGLAVGVVFAQGTPATTPPAAQPAGQTPAAQPATGTPAIQPGTVAPATQPGTAAPATGAPAQPAPAPAPGGNMLTGLLPIILILVVFYFLLIMPQQRQRKKQQEMIAALKAGDKVVVLGGIHGVITRLRDNTLHVKIADNTEIEVDRAAVSYRMGQETK